MLDGDQERVRLDSVLQLAQQVLSALSTRCEIRYMMTTGAIHSLQSLAVFLKRLRDGVQLDQVVLARCARLNGRIRLLMLLLLFGLERR